MVSIDEELKRVKGIEGTMAGDADHAVTLYSIALDPRLKGEARENMNALLLKVGANISTKGYKADEFNAALKAEIARMDEIGDTLATRLGITAEKIVTAMNISFQENEDTAEAE